MKHALQMSDSVEVAALLALSGGVMDAYSYLVRDHVFANAQTGNLLLLGIHVTSGSFEKCAKYGMPVLAFAIGIAVAYVIRMVARERHLHWRQLAVFVEICLLTCVAFMPQDMNLVANSLTSLACGIQVQAFRKLHGHAFATTMCIGNLRSGTQEVAAYIHTHNKEYVESSLLYFGTIFCFVAGAVIGNHLIPVMGHYMILISPVFLIAVILVMFIDRERQLLHDREAREAKDRRRSEYAKGFAAGRAYEQANTSNLQEHADM